LRFALQKLLSPKALSSAPRRGCVTNPGLDQKTTDVRHFESNNAVTFREWIAKPRKRMLFAFLPAGYEKPTARNG
jgi:hypothetical protein